MEVPVNVNGNEYEVRVLKNDTDYFEEGQIQNHCVRSYLDKYDSIIISVRDKTNTLERMTVEFKGECNHNILQYNKITGQKKIFTPKHGKIEGEMFDFPDGDLPF